MIKEQSLKKAYAYRDTYQNILYVCVWNKQSHPGVTTDLSLLWDLISADTKKKNSAEKNPADIFLFLSFFALRFLQAPAKVIDCIMYRK